MTFTETITITGISHDARGVGKVDKDVMFVPGSLPGETVEVLPGERKKNIRSAEVQTILAPHPERQTPPCDVYAACGGCALQIASAALAAELKQQIVREAFERIGRLKVTVKPVITMDNPYRYRNKGVFHVDDESGQARLGFFAKESHELVPAAHCLLFSEQVNHLARWLEHAITNTGRAGHIKKVMIRESRMTGDLMVVFITREDQFKSTRLIDDLQQNWPAVKSIWHNKLTNPRLMTGTVWHHLAGDETITDHIGPLTFNLSPASFFQVNNDQAEQLYNIVRKHTETIAPDTILDLYCGIGTIGLYIADLAKEIIGIESISAAIKDAKQNAKDLSIKNTHFHTAKAEQWLPKYLKTADIDRTLAIVDPPRKGLAPKLTEALIQSGVTHIIYVSCNPSTLARDCKVFARAGYNIKDVQPVDLFPQTSHVECVTLMSRVEK